MGDEMTGTCAGRPRGPAANVRKSLIRPKINSLIARFNFTLLLILGMAALLRLWRPDLNIFSYDDSYSLYLALGILDRGELPTLNLTTSVHFANPPLMAYVQAIPLFFARSPLAVEVFIAGLYTLSVWITYRLGRELFDARLAAVAAFLHALNPWAVYFARRTAVHGILSLGPSLVAYFLFTAIVTRGNNSRTFWALVALTFLTQTYLLGYFPLLSVGILLIIFWRRLPWRQVIAGGGIFVLASLPYWLALWQERATVLASWQSFAAYKPKMDTEALLHAIRLVSGRDFFIYFMDATQISNLLADGLRLVHYVLTLCLAVGVLIGVAALLRRQEGWERYLLLLLWFALPTLAMIRSQGPIHPFYQLLTYPAGFLLAAIPLSVLLRGSSPLSGGEYPQTSAVSKDFRGLVSYFLPRSWIRFSQPMVLISLSIVGLIWGASSFRAIQFIENHPSKDPYLLTIGEWLPIGERLRLAAQVPGLRAVYTNMIPPVLAAGTTTPLVVKPYLGDDFHAGQEWFTIPISETRLYAFYQGSDPVPLLAVEREDLAIKLAGGGQFRFFYHPQRSVAEARQLASHPFSAYFVSGVRLVGYDVPPRIPAGETLVLTTYWVIAEAKPEVLSSVLKVFNHLVDTQGRMVAQEDNDLVPPKYWRPGWLVVRHYPIAISAETKPGEYHLRTGLYDWQTRQRVHILEGPAEQDSSVVLGTIQVVAR